MLIFFPTQRHACLSRVTCSANVCCGVFCWCVLVLYVCVHVLVLFVCVCIGPLMVLFVCVCTCFFTCVCAYVCVRARSCDCVFICSQVGRPAVEGGGVDDPKPGKYICRKCGQVGVLYFHCQQILTCCLIFSITMRHTLQM